MARNDADRPVQFALQYRGYDRGQVDEYISSLLKYLEEAQVRALQAAQTLEEERRHGQGRQISYEELGPHIAAILRHAELESMRMREEAAAEATALREQAQAEANDLREQVHTEVSRFREDTEIVAVHLREDAQGEAARLVGAAQERAREMVEAAEARAEQVTSQASAEAERLIEQARLEAAGLVEQANAFKSERIAEVQRLHELRAVTIEHARALAADLSGAIERAEQAPVGDLLAPDEGEAINGAEVNRVDEDTTTVLDLRKVQDITAPQ